MERYDLKHPIDDMPPLDKPPYRYLYHGSTGGSIWSRIQKILKIGLASHDVRGSKLFKAAKDIEEVNDFVRKRWNSYNKHNRAPNGLCFYATPDLERAARYASNWAKDDEKDWHNPDNPNEWMPYVTHANPKYVAPIFQIDTSHTDSEWWGRDLLGPEHERQAEQYYYVGMISPEAIKLCFYDFATGKLDRNPSGSKIDQYFKGFKKAKWNDFDNVDVDSFRESTGSSYRRSYFGL